MKENSRVFILSQILFVIIAYLAVANISYAAVHEAPSVTASQVVSLWKEGYYFSKESMVSIVDTCKYAIEKMSGNENATILDEEKSIALYQEYMNRLPQKLKDELQSQGWVIRFVDESAALDNDAFVSYKNKEIVLRWDISNRQNLLYYAIGFYLDYDEESQIYYSETDEFRQIYEAEARSNQTQSLTEHAYKDYFANAFVQYMLDAKLCKQNIPQTYQYIDHIYKAYQ